LAAFRALLAARLTVFFDFLAILFFAAFFFQPFGKVAPLCEFI